ncbi:MAG: tetratricopeptide repeat protein [Calditrichia bacterium]
MVNRFNHRLRPRIRIAILLFLSLFLVEEQAQVPDPMTIYHKANAAYREGRFPEALESFKRVLHLNPHFYRQDPLLNFKIGFCYFRLGEWEKSLSQFELSREELGILEDYSLYFQILSVLGRGDLQQGLERIENFRQEFNESPLIFLIDSLKADIYQKLEMPDSALFYNLRMVENGRFERSERYPNIIRFYKELGDTASFRNFGFRFLRSFPFHSEAEEIYLDLLKSYPQRIPIPELEDFFQYLFTTDQYLAAEELVVSQSRYARTAEEKDFFNWLPVEIAYRQGEYKRVLDWCIQQRQYFNTSDILRKIDLHIARCYLNLNQVDQSIKAYLDFIKKYPSDGLAAEVLWKVGWLYENQQKVEEAIRMYQELVSRYPRASFAEEARFRIGLDYYRLAEFKKARQAWEQALKRSSDRFMRDRIRYWIGKSFEREGKYEQQTKIFIELARRPIDSFYNLKAFYLTSNGGGLHQQIKSVFWQLHHHQESHLNDHVSKFRRAILVEEMLGKKWADQELQAVGVNHNDWKEIFALGELHERMNNFGRAYRKFRTIYNSTFSEANLPEMIPIFKKLYPFYFDEIVQSVVSEYRITPALIYSVIKKESAFEPRIISYANAYGLMQLLPTTASQVAAKMKIGFHSTEQLFDPETNIKMGVHYLNSLLKRYQGNKIMALAAYNAGPHRVDRWKKIYPTYDDDLFMENLEFEQTRVYVRTCMKFYWVYRAILNPADIPEEIMNYPVDFRQFL